MATYRTPGVYVEEVSVFPPSVAQVETAIPAFIGYTADAKEAAKPVRIVSLKEYEQHFGKAQPEAFSITITDGPTGRSVSIPNPVVPTFHMYYQMQMYFGNGGGPCYIVPATDNGYPGSPSLGDLEDCIEALEGVDEPTMIVVVDANDAADRNSLNRTALSQAGKLMDRVVIMDVDEASPFTNFRTAMGTTDLSYGAAYYPKLNTSLLPYYEDNTVTMNYAANTDYNSQTLDFLLDGGGDPSLVDESIYREIKVKLDAALAGEAITLFPGGAVAGVYATVDSSRGVWKAPANISLNLVKGTDFQVTDDIQNGMNVDPTTGKSINAIRTFTGKGVLVWGARTLAGNDNEWRYISVRRFYNMVEESVKKATGAFVFEPNNANTWVKIRAMIENFLTLQWRAGALAGAKAEDAFFVRVGLGQTMDANDILEGRLIVEIGMAAVRPAEFIILRFSHMMQQS